VSRPASTHADRCSASGIGDEYSVLGGQIPLEALDWVVDAKGQRLIGYPELGGKWGMDAF
jgi:hypothetical protein